MVDKKNRDTSARLSNNLPLRGCLVFLDGYGVFYTFINAFHAEGTGIHLDRNRLKGLWMLLDFLEFEDGDWTNLYACAFAAASVPIDNNLWHFPPFPELIMCSIELPARVYQSDKSMLPIHLLTFYLQLLAKS